MSERFDIYAPIHKGLRLGSARMLERLGRADWADAETRAALLADLRAGITLGREHIEHEEAELHRAVRDQDPALSEALGHEHEEHLRAFERLEALIRAVERADDAARARAGHALYLAFSVHFAGDLLHMAHEEGEAMPLLHTHFSDEALMAMDDRIVRTIPPERMGEYLRLMIPAATPEGRAALLGAIRQGAPPEVFAGILDGIARPALELREWHRLGRDLALAA
ncbi:hypothetical protein ACFQX4_04740 [Roseomonas sp. GCM10028921]